MNKVRVDFGGSSLRSLFKDLRREVKKIVWPKRQEVIQVTFMIVLVVIFMAFLLWVIDSFLLWLVNQIIG